MFTIKNITHLFTISIVCNSCGGHGRDVLPNEPPPSVQSPSPVPPVTSMQKTKVDFDTLPYNLGIYNDPACKKLYPNHTLVKLETNDRNISDLDQLPQLSHWSPESLLGSDIAGDNDGIYDFQKIGVGQLNQDLIVSWEGVHSPEIKYVWEVGFFSTRQNTVQRAVKTLIVVSQNGVQLLSEGKTLTLGPKEAEFHSRDQRNILRISLGYFENVMSFPNWWIRGAALVGEKLSDMTSMNIFSSTLNPDYKLFSVSTCILDLKAPYDLPVTFIRDADSIAYDAQTLAFQEDFLKNIKRFVESNFVRNSLTIQLRTLSQIFFCTHRDIQPISFDWYGGLEFAQEISKGFEKYFGSIIQIRDLEPPLSPYPEHSREFAFDNAISRHFLLQNTELSSLVAVEGFAQSIQSKEGLSKYGRKYWMDRTILLAEHIRNSTKNEDQKAKILLLMSLIEPYIELEDFWKIWLKLTKEITAPEPKHQYHKFVQIIKEYASDKQKLSEISFNLDGWENELPFHDRFNPVLLHDTDLDGLPDFFERYLGTNSEERDTDRDGWGDGGEWILNKHPNNSMENPHEIIADGIFGDWQKLIPRRIFIDRNRTGLCNDEGDIELFAGLAKKSALIIGAVAPRLSGKQAIGWEIEMDFPQIAKRYVVTSSTQEIFSTIYLIEKVEGNKEVKRTPHLRILTGPSLNIGSVEWTFLSRFFDSKVDFTHKESVRLRLRTFLGENQNVCDETEWFEPAQKEL